MLNSQILSGYGIGRWHVVLLITCTMCFAAAAMGHQAPTKLLEQPLGTSETSRALIDGRTENGRVFGVGALTSIVSHSIVMTIASIADQRQSNDTIYLVGAGLSLGLAPLASTQYLRNNPDSASIPHLPIEAMILGGYAGSIAAYGGLFLFLRSDDPKVNGQYDGGYFDDRAHQRRNVGGVVFGYLLPILLPAVGLTLGYHWGKESGRQVSQVTVTPPMPALIQVPAAAGESRYIVGLNLPRLSF